MKNMNPTNSGLIVYTHLLHGKRFYQLGTGGDTERLHACMGSPVYDEEVDRGRPQVSDHLERDVLSYDSKM